MIECCIYADLRELGGSKMYPKMWEIIRFTDRTSPVLKILVKGGNGDNDE